MHFLLFLHCPSHFLLLLPASSPPPKESSSKDIWAPRTSVRKLHIYQKSNMNVRSSKLKNVQRNNILGCWCESSNIETGRWEMHLCIPPDGFCSSSQNTKCKNFCWVFYIKTYDTASYSLQSQTKIANQTFEALHDHIFYLGARRLI